MRAIVIVLINILFLSCGASDKLTRAAERSINGIWILRKVDLDTNHKGTFKIKLLDNIPTECIENTNWEFISNNNTGSYALSGYSCRQNGIYNFIWSIPKEMYGFNHSILLKPVNKKMKSELNNKGYRMQLYELGTNTMTWSHDRIVDGEKFTILLKFEKQ